MRDLGVTEWLVGLVPPAAVPLLLGVTFLGDPVFLVGLGSLGYWLGPRFGVLDRRSGARVLSVTFAALGLVLLLKHGFALGRPPPVHQIHAADGFGFPSGHATGSAATYGALAALASWRDPRTRYALAAGFAGVVGLTRLLLGVHYLVDVLAGLALGGLLAAGVIHLTARRVEHGFRLVAGVALISALAAWPSFDAAAALGGGVGALVGWECFGKDALDGRVTLPMAAIGATVFGGLAGASYVLDPPLAVVVVATGIAGTGVVGLPAVQNFSR